MSGSLCGTANDIEWGKSEVNEPHTYSCSNQGGDGCRAEGMKRMMKFKDWKNRKRNDDKYFLSTPNLYLYDSLFIRFLTFCEKVCVCVSMCLSNKFLSSFLDAFCNWMNSSSSNSSKDIFLTCIGIHTQCIVEKQAHTAANHTNKRWNFGFFAHCSVCM